MNILKQILVLILLTNLFSLQAQEKESKYGIMKLDGTILTPAIYDEVNGLLLVEPEQQYIVLRKDDQEWLIGSEGTVVNKSGYDYIGYHYDSLYDVRKDEKAGLINDKGEEIIPLAYKSFVNFDKLRHWYIMEEVGKCCKYGMIDSLNNVMISLEYSSMIWTCTNEFYKKKIDL